MSRYFIFNLNELLLAEMESSSDIETAGCELMTPSKRTSSVIWNYFGIETKDGKSLEKESATCRACCRRISAKGT